MVYMALVVLIVFMSGSLFCYGLLRDLRNIMAVRELRRSEMIVYASGILFWVLVVVVSVYVALTAAPARCSSFSWSVI